MSDTIQKGNIKVEWVELGEGLCGDYNPDDPDDIELLRFDVSYQNDKGEWLEIPDSSYCTMMPVKAPDEIRQKALQVIFNEYYHALSGHYHEHSPSVKHLGEWLSWICPEDFEQVTSRR